MKIYYEPTIMWCGMANRDPLKRDVIKLILKKSDLPLRPDEIARNFRFDEDVAEDVLDTLVAEGEVSYLGDGLYELTACGSKTLVEEFRGHACSD